MTPSQKNEKALVALRMVAAKSQLSLDNPVFRLDEQTCDQVREAIDTLSQPTTGEALEKVAKGVIGEALTPTDIETTFWIVTIAVMIWATIESDSDD